MTWYNSEAGQPGAEPTIRSAERRTAGLMFVALYGQFITHTWRATDSHSDAYSLFHQHSLAMGWLDDRGAGGGVEGSMTRAPGLWGMNDAGWHHPLVAPELNLISWFQVEASGVADDRPLPLRPFLRCAHDASERAGSVRLSAVQLLAPVQGLDAVRRPSYAPFPSMMTTRWFSECEPNTASLVEVCLSSGRSQIAAVATELTDLLRELDQDVFRLSATSWRSEIPPVPLAPSAWNGPAEKVLSLRGDLKEWTCEAIGWLAELLADVVATLGLRAPLLVTVLKEKEPA